MTSIFPSFVLLFLHLVVASPSHIGEDILQHDVGMRFYPYTDQLGDPTIEPHPTIDRGSSEDAINPLAAAPQVDCRQHYLFDESYDKIEEFSSEMYYSQNHPTSHYVMSTSGTETPSSTDFYSSEYREAQVHRSEGLENIPKASQQRHPAPRILSSHQERLHRAIVESWPDTRDAAIREKWEKLLAACITVNPRLLLNMFNGDRSAWKEVIDWSAAKEMKKRCELGFDQYQLLDSDKEEEEEIKQKEVRTAWLAGRMKLEDKDRLLNRLLLYWPGANGAAVNSRLLQYAKAYGKLQSPEPLMVDDEVSFAIAADHIAIGPVGKRRHQMLRHPNAGPYDLLHQFSSKYSVLSPEGILERIDVERTHTRPTAARYHTGQEWLHQLKIGEIDCLHDLVSSHWTSTISNQHKTRQYALLNRYLQQTHAALDQIRQGDDKVAWQYAKAVAAKDAHMKSSDEYQPSDEYMKRLGLI